MSVRRRGSAIPPVVGPAGRSGAHKGAQGPAFALARLALNGESSRPVLGRQERSGARLTAFVNLSHPWQPLPLVAVFLLVARSKLFGRVTDFQYITDLTANRCLVARRRFILRIFETAERRASLRRIARFAFMIRREASRSESRSRSSKDVRKVIDEARWVIRKDGALAYLGSALIVHGSSLGSMRPDTYARVRRALRRRQRVMVC
jgi:hypothetical protein